MIEKTIEFEGQLWRIKAVSMKAALNEISHARATGSVGSFTEVDNRLCGGVLRLIAEVHRVDDNGNDVQPS